MFCLCYRNLAVSETVFFPIASVTTPNYVDFCKGVSVGDEAFRLDIDRFTGGITTITIGKIYKTMSGKLITIVGTTCGTPGFYYYENGVFRIAPDNLPNPTNGKKGPFYYLVNGSIIYANWWL